MPFLLRIILQRVLVFAYSILVFVGIAPDVYIPTKEEAKIAVEERREKVAEVFEQVLQNTKKEEIEPSIQHNQPVRLATPEEAPIFQEQPVITTTAPKVPSLADLTTGIESIIENIPTIVASKNPVDDALVNIICVRRKGNMISVSNGSGVIVSPSGAVITAAHVAQFMLLEDNPGSINMDCTLYRENIPLFGYKADIVYISPDWIRENHQLINNSSPRGTGKNDYAILHITKNSNPSFSLPTTFSYIPFSISESEATIGREILAAGYPGAPETILDITKARNLVTDITNIQDVLTFGDNNIDVLVTQKTSVGARGSSGGGVFGDDDKDNFNNPDKLIGVIITTNGSSGRDNINATTISYINRDLIKESNHGLSYYTNGNLSAKTASFRASLGKELADLIESEF